MKKVLRVICLLILVISITSCSSEKIIGEDVGDISPEEITTESYTNDNSEAAIKVENSEEAKETEIEVPEEKIESLDTENELKEVFEDDFNMDDLDTEFDEMDSLLEGWE